jgi:hypothetical protein
VPIGEVRSLIEDTLGFPAEPNFIMRRQGVDKSQLGVETGIKRTPVR